jgi:hypothetical protein
MYAITKKGVTQQSKSLLFRITYAILNNLYMFFWKRKYYIQFWHSS